MQQAHGRKPTMLIDTATQSLQDQPSPADSITRMCVRRRTPSSASYAPVHIAYKTLITALLANIWNVPVYRQHNQALHPEHPGQDLTHASTQNLSFHA